MAWPLESIISNNPSVRIMKKSLNPLPVICLIFLLVFSCKKDKPGVKTCDVLYPSQELPWLRNKIDGLEQLSPDISKYYMITMATYQGETVFIETNCDPLGNSAFPVYNCSGDQIGFLGQISQANLTNRSILWIPVNSACGAKG